METRVYRKRQGLSVLDSMEANGHRDTAETTPCTLTPEGMAWHAGLFYPRMCAEELEIWAHWLPTTIEFTRSGRTVPDAIITTLTELHAPPAVLEEWGWSWQMELFDAYELKTPTRRDLRDPLLIGRYGHERYRLALWGESLRPLEEIREIVQRSLAIRRRVAWWRTGMMVGGALMGLCLGPWLGSQASVEGSPIGLGLAFALCGLLLTWLPAQVYTSESRQQDFLDRYRREACQDAGTRAGSL